MIRLFAEAVFKTVNVACAAHFCATHLFSINTMAGPSMLPTFANSGEVVFQDKFSIRQNPWKNIARGDLVVFSSPLHPRRNICKRVLGLPGDTVCVDPTGEYAPSSEHVVVPKGHVWVIGDNSSGSRDSRHYGPLSMSLISSKVLARIWPVTRLKLFTGGQTTLIS